MEGRWSGGQEGICGNGGTEDVHLEKRKRWISKDVALENVAREVTDSLTYPISIMQSCFRGKVKTLFKCFRFRLGWDELQELWISWIYKRFVCELTVFCGGLCGSSPGLFLPKQATRHASLNSELKTVKTSITHRPCGAEQWQERDRRSKAGSVLTLST